MHNGSNRTVPTNHLAPSKPEAQHEVRAAMTWNDFHAAGISVSAWARVRGFNPRLVYEILRGERKCLRGASALIAKELGMK